MYYVEQRVDAVTRQIAKNLNLVLFSALQQVSTWHEASHWIISNILERR